jgi:FSR family fosmidomycin resistance protein-like MFS transporter
VSAVAAAGTLPRLDRRGLGVLSFGHLSVDLAQGMVPALLPFLVAERGYSYGAAGALLLFSSVGSSFLQPLLGAFADRISASWMMWAGTLLAAAGAALCGQFDDYLATGAALVVSSIGVAMYHPEAVRFASYVAVAAERQGTGMSMFAVGGLSGWALGPILTTPVVALWGLHATPLVALVPLAATALLVANMHYLERFRPTAESEGVARESMTPSDWRGFTIAASAGTLRTGSLFALQAFVPLYVWRTLESSEGVGNIAISAMLAAGALGTLIGGRLSDLHGFRRVVIWSLVVSAPLGLLVPVVPLFALFPVLALLGLIAEMNFYPIVVLAQKSLPRHVGFASGVTLGLSIGIGSLASPLLGLLADATTLRTALVGAGLLTVLAALLSFALPRPAT